MAPENTAHGQPSPPRSSDEHHPIDYDYGSIPSHAMLAPYTPPMQSYNYADPEEYDLHRHQDHHDDDDPSYYPETTYHTPPQPIAAGGMQTRSGRSIGTPMSASSPSSRLSASPRPKRNRKGKDKGNNEQFKITEPLSVMTKDYDVPVEDMDAWVTRPNQVRYEEIGKKHKGGIPRPMNSFMLYRRAYKERIKKWGAQGDNNQMISSVAGCSWHLEPQHIKDYYNKIAKTESDNHAKAFPDYKFSPNKTKKKQVHDDEEDTDPEWDGGSVYSNKRRRGRHDRDVTRSRSSTPAHMMYGSPQMHPSSYQIGNHLMPVPQYEQWAQPVQYGQYYSYDHMGYPSQGHAMSYGPRSVPVQQERYISPLVGLPPTTEGLVEGDGLIQPDFGIDPSLDDYAPQASYHYGSFSEGLHEHDLRRSQYEEPEPVIHPGMQTLAPAESSWDSTNHAGHAFDTELNRWPGEQ
ncbi:hypothetical protein LTR05_001930 [Lithohypha guttulata]|uniref:HMG box domain-containing protein n=1 Tax=Lithohypha guttulata TaxID=1690604 RepID=A0AAN7T8J1_9EURO|nr:hypothetical protein LTR05_001930 [Lithohypha guttulata]